MLKRIAPGAGARAGDGATMRYVDQALLGTTERRHHGLADDRLPLDQVHIRSKTGTAEVQGKQSTSWVASYDENFVVVMMVSQAGTGSGTSGPAVRAIWESLYGVPAGRRPERAAIAGTAARRLPTFLGDGSVLPPDGRPAMTAR